ncbi:MAG: LUD domain-containing protein [Sphingobacteriales bacterium]|jgi:L-lactate dehydrogenase complex protein LldF|nr:LUD domain-containing protein [Sphingobacteriales bacterium]
MHAQERFTKATKDTIADKEYRQKMGLVLDNLASNQQKGTMVFSNLALAKQRAAYTKWKVAENLDKYLLDFEGSVIRKGGKVIWANDAQNALTEIDAIIKRTQATKIVKSRSELSHEIGLVQHLRKMSVKVAETGFGDYLIDLMGEKPFHSVLPALNQSATAVGAILNKKIKSSLDANQEEIASDIRAEIRNSFFEADIGITGANFLIADSGMVAITENEGNERLSFAFAKTHIILASIDKVLPSISDLELFFSLFSTHALGQQLATYNTVTGPSLKDEKEGPSEFIVILIDNGRSNLLATQDQRQALSCIKCGACSNVCPVFKIVGGHANYQSYGSGPIGQIVAPLQQGFQEFQYLGNLSTICGKCTDVCPVNIDLHNHLLRNRHENLVQGFEKTGEKLAWYTWKKFMLSRKTMNRPASIKNFTFRQFYKNDWGESREFPKIAEKSFNQLWREKNGLK